MAGRLDGFASVSKSHQSDQRPGRPYVHRYYRLTRLAVAQATSCSVALASRAHHARQRHGIAWRNTMARSRSTRRGAGSVARPSSSRICDLMHCPRHSGSLGSFATRSKADLHHAARFDRQRVSRLVLCVPSPDIHPHGKDQRTIPHLSPYPGKPMSSVVPPVTWKYLASVERIMGGSQPSTMW